MYNKNIYPFQNYICKYYRRKPVTYIGYVLDGDGDGEKSVNNKNI